jgi:hypothetical protein
MRVLKLGLISIVVFSVLIFLLSLLIPSHVRISRAVNINDSRDSLASRIMDIRQWKSWNQLLNDSDITNSVYDYKVFHSDQLQVEFRRVKTDSVLSVWRRSGGKEVVSTVTWQKHGATTVVQWYFDFYLHWYPWEKFSSIVFDKQLGPPMERSLASLKKQVEQTP